MASVRPLPRVRDVIDALERRYPSAWHDPDDPPPFAFGDPDAPVRRLTVALDAGPATVERARRRGVDMILAHHPPFYRAARALAQDSAAGRLARRLHDARLAVYALHLALDRAPDGTADALARAAGLASGGVALVPGASGDRVGGGDWWKIAAFVPASHREAVRAALDAAGAGALGAYSGCSFSVAGEGAFRPGAGARPFVGAVRKGRRRAAVERVAEWKIEAIVPEARRAAAVDALRRVHPYEEPAFDLIPVAPPQPRTRPAAASSGDGTASAPGEDGAAGALGFGRVGPLARPVAWPRFVEGLVRAVGSTQAQAAPPVRRGSGARASARELVRRVAVWPGADFPPDRLDPARMDVVVTGEMRYHVQEALAEAGVGWVLLGHGWSERPVLAPWAAAVRRLLPGVPVSVDPGAGPRVVNV